MEIVSINVGMPKEVTWHNKTVLTSIFKNPVSGSQKVSFLNISGDKQSDLSVHGGPDKAVYAYASEHYKYWKEIFPDKVSDWGMFGENLTISGGLFENEINIGDCFKVGTSILMAVQPRVPCFKLGIRFGTEKIIKLFMKSGLSGVYFRVLQEGDIETGQIFEKINSAKVKLTVSEINRIFSGDKDLSLLEKAAYHPDLAENLIGYFREILSKKSNK
jgi:MOSC domain-containing protein YiiM